METKGIKIGFLGYCDHVPDRPNCTVMRMLYNSGPAIYRDDIATRDVNKLRKVKFIWNCSWKTYKVNQTEYRLNKTGERVWMSTSTSS